MKREIKFRAWDGEEMIYEIVPLPNGNVATVYVDAVEPWQSDKPESVMQFTGLIDKNGKEIYEGDIVNMPYGQDFEVIYYKNGFYLNDGIYSRFDGDECCVIGNIYESPELIK